MYNANVYWICNDVYTECISKNVLAKRISYYIIFMILKYKYYVNIFIYVTYCTSKAPGFWTGLLSVIIFVG